MSSEPNTEETASRTPRFFVWKDGDGVWTWGYRRPGEKAPHGVRTFVHTRQEAVEIARSLNSEEAARRAVRPETQSDLFNAGGR